MSGSISVNGSTSLGVITSPPSFSFDITSNKSTGVNYYLDGTSYWIGGEAISFDEWEGGTTTRNESMSQSTWNNLEDGEHTLYIKGVNGENTASITFIKNNSNTPDPLPPSYDPPAYNPPIYDPSSWYYPHSSDTIPPPSYPNFKDNEVVKMGILCKITNHNGEVKTEYIKQNKNYYEDWDIDTIPRYRDSSVISAYESGPYWSREQIKFVDADNSLDEWEWIKTTIDKKTFLISTTFAPQDYLYPLNEVIVSLKGTLFKLRSLTSKEWFKVDKSILEKMDWDGYYHTPTRTFMGKDDSYYNFLLDYTDDEFNKWMDNNLAKLKDEHFEAITYIPEKMKTHVISSRVSKWEYFSDYMNFGTVSTAVSWIPVLELVNTSPSIVLPDKDKEDKVIHL